jgi:SAM-dependent methyltransferase
LAEFTGERVIPGKVDTALWHEHLARYAFAARLARRKRVLDAGCGAGYGAAEMSRVASSVVGVDVAEEAIRYSLEHYSVDNLRFARASSAQLPFAAAAFDLVVAFEVIEHLNDWREFLQEVRRVLAPGGQCVISTPNKDYYTASRGASGANPYHHHEFTFREFRDELAAVFPHVSLFLQNRAEGFVFQPVNVFTPAEARVDSGAGEPEESNFFVAVCALAPQTGAPTFLFMPRAANILREREHHIEKLDAELELKERRIAELTSERDRMIALFNNLQEETAGHLRGYEAKVAELEQENRRKTEWAIQTEQRLTAELAAKCQELQRAVDALHAVEETLDDRTRWAQDLDRRVNELEAELSLLRSSRWMRLGSALRMGPGRRDR